MEESGATGGAGENSAKVPATYSDDEENEWTGFHVELKPGETTIVSWKKLVRDAKAAKEAKRKAKEKCLAPEVPPVAQPALESRVDPGQLPEKEPNDAPPASRFNAVIEKIERLYMGNNSSDEEDLNDIPDDDEYDTEDSFIDDTELDEYFQVDNSKIKHDGFFVNRGTLERIEPTISPEQQQKKRRRKELAKGPGGSDEGNATNKHVKVGKKASGKSLALSETNSTNPTLVMALPTINPEDLKVQSQSNSSGINAKKRSADMRSAVHQSPLKVSNGEGVAEEKGDKLRAGVFPAKNRSKLRDGNEFSDTSSQMLGKPHDGRSLDSGEDLGKSASQGGKNISHERPDSISSEGKNFTQAAKVPQMQRKGGSSVKSKTTMLEKAIRELEKIIAESRPPSIEASDADISQATKRRMPPEIKPKLAKIARLAHSIYGIISKELLKRLMSIVGHLMQMRTLKRNLNAMVMGLSEKEKLKTNARFQQIKKEIDQMVKIRIPLMKSSAREQPGGASDDFQENDNAQKEVLKRRFSMDTVLEDKICNLYDLYVEGLEEDSGPQVRKLYTELAELWPKGFMDNHGIKRAICRAKDRKKTPVRIMKDDEKMKRKKVISKTEEARRGDIDSVARSQQEMVVTNTSAVSMEKVSGTTGAETGAQFPTVVVNVPNLDRPKQEKLKGNSNISSDMKTSEKLAKKKLKRKAESEVGEAHARPAKLLIPEQGEEKNKSLKQTTVYVQKTDLQLTAAATKSEK